MSGFRTGNFEKERVAEVFHPFVPAHAASSLHAVDLDGLWAAGKRLLMLDVDNTLVQWRAEVFPEPVLEWVRKAQAMGFDLCVLSNTRRPERLARLAAALGVETVKGRFKPSRTMFRSALDRFHRPASEAVMIGDQIFTDVLGANRAGIEAIWVARMSSREFKGTAISRLGERLLRSVLYRALVTPVDESDEAVPAVRSKPFMERAIVRQILKFCIVGGTSFVIDTGLTMVLMKVVRVGGELLSTQLGGWVLATVPLAERYATSPESASAPILGGFAALVAMFNSFVFNRSWTFSVKGKEERLAQLRRFYLVSILGAFLSTAIFSGVYNLLAATTTLNIAIAKVTAAGIVAVWNFLGQRLYAFRKPA